MIKNAKFTEALSLAVEAHEGRYQKSSNVPYIVHVVEVAGLVARFGGDEELQIAGILHDVLDHGGPEWVHHVDKFGHRVSTIVQNCNHCIRNPASGKKLSWSERMKNCLAHLAEAHEDTLLVLACDKLNTLQVLLDDLHEKGLSAFDRFETSQAEVLELLSEFSKIFTERKVQPAAAFRRKLKDIQKFLDVSE